MMNTILVVLALGSGALGESIDGFANLWQSTWRNIRVPRVLHVSGSIPLWLEGSLLKNGGGAFETAERNVTYAFDGIPKIFKFHVAGGRVAYQERFLSTGYYEYIESHHDIPKVPLMGATEPPLDKFEAPNAAAGDIDNIQVWHLKGDDRIFALTDAALVDTFNLETLQSMGSLPLKDEVQNGLVQLSCAHPQYDPNSNQTVLLNFASTLFGTGTLLGHHEMIVFRMGIDKVRRPFGSVTVPYAPYIHSFSVTKTKMILVTYPLGFGVTCVMEFSPLIECMSCPKDRNATVYVFDLASTTKETKPLAIIEAPHHMVMHHVNAYDDADTGDAVFEVSAQDRCDTLFSGPTGKHANLAAMRDRSARDKVQHWGKLRTFRLALGNTEKTGLAFADTVLRDAEGYVYSMDFPFVNPNFAAQHYSYIYALSSYAQNSTHYEDWAILKIDRGKAGVNTQVWFKKGHYPGEPVFVPKPGAAAEDEGLLLTTVLDGQEKRGYLLVLDAKTMTEVATASLDAGEHLPYTQHGRWFDDGKVTAMVV